MKITSVTEHETSQMFTPVISQVFTEQGQAPETRKEIIEKLEVELGRPVLTYFTSFKYPFPIEESDVDIIEGFLQTMDLSKGLALFISSPGGAGIAAIRIINACRKYSGTNDYWAIVPSRAKSAATLICMGASKIIMGVSSELGPVDPQWFVTDEKGDGKSYSVYDIVESYDKLFSASVNEEKGNLEPYLQQLKEYHPWDMQKFRKLCALSKDIAVEALETGMMKDQGTDEITKKIGIFLTTQETKVHERPIFIKEAKSCNLNIEEVGVKDDLWKLIYELYIRTNNYVSTRAVKTIESKEQAYGALIQKGD